MYYLLVIPPKIKVFIIRKEMNSRNGKLVIPKTQENGGSCDGPAVAAGARSQGLSEQ